MRRAGILLALAALLLSACASRSGSSPAAADSTPPPGATSLAPAAGFTPYRPEQPTATSECVNDLRWDQDLTIPDGTNVDPGDPLDKRWQVTNTGTCNWDERYSVRLIGGPAMGAGELQALIPARAGAQVFIRIQFITPQTRGTTISAWQAFDQNGEPFGDPFFIQIYVR